MKLVLLFALACAAPALAQSPGEVAQRVQMVRAYASAQNEEWGASPVVRMVVIDSSQAPAVGRVAGAALGGWFAGALIGGGAGAVFGYSISEDDDFFGRDFGAFVFGSLGAFAGGAIGAPLTASRVGARGGVLGALLGVAIPVGMIHLVSQSDNSGDFSTVAVVALFPISAVLSTVLADQLVR